MRSLRSQTAPYRFFLFNCLNLLISPSLDSQTNLVKTLPEERGHELEVGCRNFTAKSFHGETEVLFGRLASVLLPVAISLNSSHNFNRVSFIRGQCKRRFFSSPMVEQNEQAGFFREVLYFYYMEFTLEYQYIIGVF
jgi:hypothetical protein